MSDICLNIKEKSISNFDIKQYEMINEFNIIFSCNNVGNILSIYSKDHKKKTNHPLLLNGYYCIFCREVLDKNLFYLKYNHKNINLKKFLNDNKIKFRRVFNKEKIYKRRFIHSSEHNNKNINLNDYSKNENKSQSDTEEYFTNNKEITLFINENDSNSSSLNKEKLEDIIQDINLLPTTISSKNNYKSRITKSKMPSSEINYHNIMDTDSNLNLIINKKVENNTTSKKLINTFIKHNSVLYPIKKKISNLKFARIKSNFSKSSNLNSNKINSINNDFICNICFDSIHDKFMLECGHFYCKLCIINLINSCLENISMFNKIKCPNEFCQHKINSNIVEDLCDNNTFLKYKKFEKRINALSNEKYIPCPYINCDGYGEKINIKKNILKCEECQNYFCTICLTIINFKQKKIEKKIKEEKKEEKEKEEEEEEEEKEEEEIDISKIKHNCLESQSKIDKLTEEYCEKNPNIKKCPKCHCWVEKIKNNCNNMKCSNIWCNYEFCWICMKKYDNGHYKNPFSECFGLSQSDINSNFANYKGARILKCILISLIVMFILFPMFVNFFSLSLIALYLKFFDTNRKKIIIKNNKLKCVYVVIEYSFYFLISLALISLGYLVLLILIIYIPINFLIGKCKNEEDNLM